MQHYPNGQVSPAEIPDPHSPATARTDLSHVDLDTLLNAISEGVYLVDCNRTIQKWSPGAVRLTGFSFEEVECRSCSDNILVHVDSKGRQLCKDGCPLLLTLLDGEVREARVFLRHKNGYRLPVQIRTVAIRDAEGKIIGAVEAFREVADNESLINRMEELEEAAFIDPVTGLPNRRYMETQIDRLISDFTSSSIPSTLCLLDVDEFKLANDGYGHLAGDAVLRTMAQTLHNCLRSTDILGRWGGDEFLLLLPRTGSSSAMQTLERCRVLVESSTTPFEGRPIQLTVSLGAAVIAEHDTAATLLARADDQLYKAKHLGRNCWQLDGPGNRTTRLLKTSTVG